MTSNVVDSLARAFIPALVLSVFALARRYLPAKALREPGTAYSLEELSARFAFTQWLVGGSMLLVGVTIAWGTHSLLVTLNRLFADLDGPFDLVLFPQAAIWWFLPGFAAITMAWEITLGAWSLIGDKREVVLYNYWTAAKAGFDSTRVLRIMGIVIVLPIAIFTALALPEHVALGHDKIRARGYGFSGVRTYRYSDARRMTVIDGFRDRDGTLVKRAGVVLDFSDGRRWSSADISEFKPTVDPKLFEFLRASVGLRPQYFDTASDIPHE